MVEVDGLDWRWGEAFREHERHGYRDDDERYDLETVGPEEQRGEKHGRHREFEYPDGHGADTDTDSWDKREARQV